MYLKNIRFFLLGGGGHEDWKLKVLFKLLLHCMMQFLVGKEICSFLFLLNMLVASS